MDELVQVTKRYLKALEDNATNFRKRFAYVQANRITRSVFTHFLKDELGYWKASQIWDAAIAYQREMDKGAKPVGRPVDSKPAKKNKPDLVNNG